LTVHSELSGATARLSTGDISDLNADFDLLFSEGYLSLNGGASGLGGILSYEGSAEVDLGDLETQWKAGIPPEDLAAQVLFDLSASVIGLDLPTLPWKTLGVSPSYLSSLKQGMLGADLNLSGTLGAPQLRYTLAVEDVEFWPQYRPGDLRALDVVLDGSLDEKGINASLSAAEGGAGFFSGNLALKLPLSDLLGADLATLPPPSISLSLKTVPLDAARIFALLEKRSEASGTVWAIANVRGNLPLTWPAKLPGVDINFYGDKLSVDGISLVGKSLPSKERAPLFAARLQESTLTWNLDVSSTDGKSNLYSQGVLPLDLSAEIPLSPETPISRAVLRAKRFDLALFALASPSVRSLRGFLSTNGDLRVTGTVGQPNINGTVSVFDGQLAIDGFPTFKDVTLRAAFTPEEIELERLTVRAGKGEANINGSIKLENNRPKDFLFTLTANEFDIPYDGQSMAMLNDFESSLSGRFEESRLVSTLIMERGKFQLPSIFSDTGKDLVPLGSLEDVSFVSQHDAEVAALQSDTPASEAKPFFYELNLEIPGNFFITGAPPEAIGTVNSLRLELGGKLRIDAAPDSLSFVGEIKLLKGSELVIVDDNFVFSEESSLSFIGADLDPRLALEATAEVQDASNSYKVTLFIGGTASSPEIRITSDPFLEEGQIATLLLTGQAEGKAEGDASQTLRDGLLGTTDAITSAVVGVGVGALIQNTPLGDIKEYLKLDVLRLDSQQLEIGKYIGKKCYAGLKYRFLGTEATVGEDTSNRPEGNFICRIGRGWGLNGHYGGASKTGSTAAGIDVLWSKDY
jgi:translocation and assembly module TamB